MMARRFPSATARVSMVLLAASWIQRQHRVIVSAWTFHSRRACPLRLTVNRASFTSSRLIASAVIADADEHQVENESTVPAAIQAPAKFVAFPFQYRQEIEVQIESLTNQGLGIARVPIDFDDDKSKARDGTKNNDAVHTAEDEDEEGEDSSESTGGDKESPSSSSRPWVVMVPNVIPGEKVIARVFRNYPSYSEADFVRVVGDPSPDRILSPPCPISEECGGCQYQHISMERQRLIKTEHTKEAFQQYGLLLEHDTATTNGADNILHLCTGTNDTLQYRSKLTPHYDAPRKMVPVIGFQRQMSRQVIDVESCCIATPQVNAKYQAKRADLLISLVEQQRQRQEEAAAALAEELAGGGVSPKRKKKRKSTGATLLFRQGNLQDEHVSTNHSEVIRTSVHDVHFDYQAGNFFQNNYYVLPLMVDLVLNQATNPLTGVSSSAAPPTHLIDCYCGSGLFAISCAARAKPAFTRVIGIEINAKAIDEATRNAALNGLTADQVAFMAASAENIFAPVIKSSSDAFDDDETATTASSSEFPPESTVVVIDPPRKGCSPQFLDLLLEFGPARVVYVSCNVVTQGRDAKVLVDAGYECTYIQPLDLFPQTRHVECVATFEKR